MAGASYSFSSIFQLFLVLMALISVVQVLGLLVEVMKKEFEKHISSLLPRARTIFKSAISEVTNRSEDYTDESTIPFWKEAYYSLIMLEKILHEFPDLCFERDLEVCYNCAPTDF